MYKYKITSIADHQGVPKQEFFDELNEKHKQINQINPHVRIQLSP